MIYLTYYLQLGTNDTIQNGTVTTQNIINSWDKQWLDLLQNNTNNNLYGILTQLGIFFAVGTLLFFIMQWIKDVLENEYTRPLSSLIFPLIVVFLLANPGNGTLLSNLTLGVRNFINSINQQVIETADINSSYQQALNMSIAEEVAGSFLRPCQSLTGEQQNQCLIKAKEKIDTLWQSYRDSYGAQLWISRLETRVNNIVFNIGNVSEINFNSLLGSTFQTSIKNILVSLQSAFQNLIEATMLLVAALGPLAVGGSLLPVAGKPIYAWLTGFLSMGIAKISFNIIVAMTSSVIVNSSQDVNSEPDLMWFLIFLGILAPILSLILAAVGGFAVFTSVSNAGGWVRDRV
jgi:hypothetical protein